MVEVRPALVFRRCEIWESAGSVRMLVYIDFASAVKRSVLGGRLRPERMDFSVKESLK